MAGSETWAGWIRLGAILMLIIGVIDFFQGLIAIIRGGYYAHPANQVVIVDTRAWGWILLIWGIVVGANWARWAAIFAASLNIIVQLGFEGGSQHTLWTLTSISLTAIVLYALLVHWEESSETLRRMTESRM